ncbi:ergothioneine biosynthesis protein EgtB [Nocardioides sp. CFH 31398]|uniref:ergothioneine biosynthesis protein EgtB n=1 Tax=Nocardioides sp. CFH 31398 TaxID=2919579 RepID=UPI001F0596CD|nr:ergothioneine biosynthesis protein EgtB [Nocardioides sp. CFH 31398]MCH1868349.1 ergothioneine biosynthesis protein EgtB [Nocardioides sp. CFH 31398]
MAERTTLHEEAARGLEDARRRTERLTDLDVAELTAQHSPLMSPLVWDLAHIGQQEDLWLLRGGNALAQGRLSAEVEKLYDAFEHPRASRVALPLLGPDEARGYLADVRGRALEGLDGTATTDGRELFAFSMVAQHEQQHVETMTATHQLRRGEPLLGGGTPLPPGRPVAPDDAVLVPAGEFMLGVDGTDEPWSLDNERPAHRVQVPAFRIGRVPVTNADWQRFVDAGGYDEPRWWSARGWEHRLAADLERPLFWSADGSRRRFGIVEEVPADEPVQHVCFFEAEAYAAWAGARLPTEVEWEKACVWDPALDDGRGARRRWPWGGAEPSGALANLGGEALRPAPVGAYPAGASPYGVEQMIGDVWEWTSSDFHPWPGFSPMLYADYSAPFFGGDYKVLRGGSWAVGAPSLRPSFRNWDHPVRRQVFCGLRLAWDA